MQTSTKQSQFVIAEATFEELLAQDISEEEHASQDIPPCRQFPDGAIVVIRNNYAYLQALESNAISTPCPTKAGSGRLYQGY